VLRHVPKDGRDLPVTVFCNGRPTSLTLPASGATIEIDVYERGLVSVEPASGVWCEGREVWYPVG
jgi:hypothetical protein